MGRMLRETVSPDRQEGGSERPAKEFAGVGTTGQKETFKISYLIPACLPTPKHVVLYMLQMLAHIEVCRFVVACSNGAVN